MKPVLLLDVDGVLNVYGRRGVKNRTGGYFPSVVVVGDTDYSLTLHRDNAALLYSLKDLFDFVWCTSWNYLANDHIAPLFDWDTFPVLELDDSDVTWTYTDDRLHWKTATVADAFSDGGVYAGRRFVWVDDETTRTDKNYFAAVFGKHYHYLSLVDPGLGYTDFLHTNILNWLENHAD